MQNPQLISKNNAILRASTWIKHLTEESEGSVKTLHCTVIRFVSTNANVPLAPSWALKGQ